MCVDSGMTNPHLTKIDRAISTLDAAVAKSAELPCEDAVQHIKDAVKASLRLLDAVRDELEEEALDV